MSKWPEGAEEHRRLALSHVWAAREFADRARQSVGSERRESVADCRRNIVEALLNVRDARETPTSNQDRWPVGAVAKVELADGHLVLAWEKVQRVDTADEPLGNALLAEIGALCADVVWFLTVA